MTTNHSYTPAVDRAGRNLLVRGGAVWTDGGAVRADIEVRDGIITAVAPDLQPEEGMPVLDAAGLTVLPGLVDLHVHLREPGLGYKETVAGGTEAAARGGFTTVCAMPNVNPAPDRASALQEQLDIIDRDARIEVLPYLTITHRRLGGEPMDPTGVDMTRVAGFSDDGNGVQDERVMARAMHELGHRGLFAVHCEVDSLLRKGYIHDGEYCRTHGHRGICSESEWREVERDIRLAAAEGIPLHICHVSTAESVELVRRAKARGEKVTCETGPHYLAYCDEDLREEGRFKMNPPLRSRADRDALRAGVADGTVDVIATDHAPHSDEEKARGLELSAMGVVGLETSFAAVYTHMVLPGRMTFGRLVEAMSDHPRRLLGREPGIKPGLPADLTLVDTEEKWTVCPEEFAGKGHSTPFAGETLQGRPVATVWRGRTVWDRRAAGAERTGAE